DVIDEVRRGLQAGIAAGHQAQCSRVWTSNPVGALEFSAGGEFRRLEKILLLPARETPVWTILFHSFDPSPRVPALPERGAVLHRLGVHRSRTVIWPVFR